MQAPPPVVAPVAPVVAPALDSARNPFAGFETRVLGNGLKVWFNRVPGFRDVSVSVIVPYGSDLDPPGKAQLAHFTEHMLFSDRNGRTEEQIKMALDRRGGTRNGITTWDRTYYFARVERQHGLFAIGWLHGILAPHEMRPDVVERQRSPVLLELGVRKRDFFDKLGAFVADPPYLRRPGWWEREFGLEIDRPRRTDLWETVHAITPADLRGFYDRYYVPNRMTLTIIGDLPADSVWSVVARTFGTLARRPVPPGAPSAHDPGRERRDYRWSDRANVVYDERFKLFGYSARDEVLLTFVSRFLSKRLEDQLRFGERKAVYSARSFVLRRGDVAQLTIASTIKREEYAFARRKIAEELERLRTGTLSDSIFIAERDGVAARLRSETTSATALDSWVWNAFYSPDRFRDFPDLVSEIGGLSKTEVEAFARRVLVPERRLITVNNVAPLRPPALGVLVAGLLLLALWISRRLLVRRLPMERLRYVANIQRPIVYFLTVGVAYCVVVLIVLRLLYFGFQLLSDPWFTQVNSFVVRCGVYTVMGAIMFAVVVMARAIIPSKLLVFDDGMALKSMAYRSRFIPASAIVDMSIKDIATLCREVGVRGALRTTVLSPGIILPALHIRLADGRGLFLRARNTSELLEALRALRGQVARTDRA